MPGLNWRENQGQVQAIGGGEVTSGGLNWSNQLPPGFRHTIANKLLDALKKHHPISGEEGLHDLEETAIRFEESTFTTATSQSDYLRGISLKMHRIESESQNLGVNPLQTNAASSSRDSQDPGMGRNEWRIQLQSEYRTRIVNKIVETLKWHLPFSGLEGQLEIERIAVRFEERIYSSARSLSDYLRKISLKMLTMGTRYQTPIVSYNQFNAASDSANPQNPDNDLVG